MDGVTRRLALGAGASLAFLSPDAYCEPSEQALVRRIQAHCERLSREHEFSGAVMLVRNKRPLVEKTYGLRNRADKLAVRLDTKFNVASIGKLFTSLAIMRFAAAGAIRLDAPLLDAWPDYPHRSVAERITIAQLLTHTAGLGNNVLFKPKTGLNGTSTHQDYLRLFLDDGVTEEPGGEAAYSNDGYVLLGALIEKLSGLDFREHCRRTIFDPLGMTSTGFSAPDDIVPNLAIPYVRDLYRPGVWRSALGADAMPGGAFGGGYSTVADLCRFGRGMLANQLLTPEWSKTWTQGRVAFRGEQYGFGVQVSSINGHQIIGHTGGHSGVAGELLIAPDLGYVFAVLSNGEVEPYWDLDTFVRSEIAGDHEAARTSSFTRELIEVVIAKGVEAGVAFVAQQDRTPREGMIDVYAFRVWHRGDADGAENLLLFNQQRFPDSLSALWSLAEFYRYARRNADAIAAYQAYLQREPDDADALGYIAQLS